MGNRFDIRQQIVMRRLTIASLLQHRQRKIQAVTSLPALASNDSYVGAAACVQHTGKLAACQQRQQRIRAVLLQRGVLFILRCGPPNAAAIACLFTCAMQHLQQTVDITRFMRLR